jgi:hypothetical protein
MRCARCAGAPTFVAGVHINSGRDQKIDELRVPVVVFLAFAMIVVEARLVQWRDAVGAALDGVAPAEKPGDRGDGAKPGCTVVDS